MAEDSSQFEDFYRGLSYLGKPTAISLAGQEPASPGGLQAGGAPVSPSGMGAAGPTVSTIGTAAGMGTSPGMSPALQGLLRASGLGTKLAGVASDVLGGAPSAGAIETPGGQLTVSAPEILRGMQFPEGTGLGEMPGPSIPSGVESGTELAGSLGDIYGGIGTGAGLVGSALGLVNALRPGTIPPGVEQGFQAIAPLLSGPMTGIGTGASIIASIIADMVSDPKGQRSAAQDFNYVMSQQVPGEMGALQLAAASLPAVSDQLSTDQALQLYQIARAGLKSWQLLAEPLSLQGKRQAGEQFTRYPGAEEAGQQLAPQAWLAATRLEDILAQRGIQPNDPRLDPAASPFASELYGVPTPSELGSLPPESAAFYQQQYPHGTEGESLWLTPGALLGQIGGPQNIGGDPAALLAAYGDFASVPPSQGGYVFDPATMAKLGAIQPGQYEAGLRSLLNPEQLATLYGGAPAQAASPATETSQAMGATAAEPGALQYPAPPPVGGGTVFEFGSAP